MNIRWMFSEFYTDELLGMMAPVAAAYSNGWQCPCFPDSEGGSALVAINCDGHQVEAAKQDSRITVCPLLFDASALPQTIIDAYASMGATTGMSIGTLIATLAESVPVYANMLSQS